ncbi:hypothetical protein ACLI09_02440 [Flavobacterium sp. RHBU_24]|uniref:hypothetical protein n=1 Tax=Flavobacterium sp. RHBU_24 TaxID=3391185 RepID=UPI003984D5F1
MAGIIKIEFLENNTEGHNDLLFSVPGLVEECFDSYYFIIAEGMPSVKKTLAALLDFWVQKIKALQEGNVIYLPIDFSDQYTGCLRVEMEADKLMVDYGYSLREGWCINPRNPEDFYNSVTDFTITSESRLTIIAADFANAIKHQAVKLQELNT